MRALRAALCAILVVGIIGAALPSHAEERWVWRPTLPTSGFGTYLSAFANGATFAYDDGEDRVYKSNDFGLTWIVSDSPVELNPPVAAVPSVFEMVSPKVGFFYANGGLYKTTDATATWKEIDDLPTPGGFLTGTMRRHYISIESIDASDKGDVVALGGSLGNWDKACKAEGTLASVWTSHNRGKTWFRTTLPFSGAVHDVTFFDDLHGVAISTEFEEAQRSDGFCLESFRDVVLYTEDGGRTFDEIKYCSHGANGNACTAAGMSTARKFIVGTSTGLTYRTTDGGRTFKRGALLHQGMPGVENIERWYWVEGIDFATDKIGFAATNGGSTWKTRNGGRTWIEEPSTEKLWGYLKFGDIAVADADHAVSAGSAFVITRTGVPTP